MADTPSPSAAERPSPLKRPGIRIGLTVFLVTAVLVGGYLLWHHETVGKYMEDTDDAYIQADAVTVAPKIAGYVQQVLVHENQDVKAGQVLLRIDARDYQAQAAQAKAQIDVATANADAVKAQILEQDASIAQARAQVGTAQAASDYADAELARYTPLARTGAETTEQLAAKRNQAAQAASQLASVRAGLAIAERRVASLQAQVQQARSQGEAAAAQLDAAKVNVQSADVQASIDGRVGDSTVRVGQFVQQGTRLMSIVPLDKLYITANFKETQIGRMRPGQTATIKVDALGGLQLKGHVESISPGTGAQFSLLPPQNATGNFTKIVQRLPVRVALDVGPEARSVLVPGLSVTVVVDTLAEKDSEARIRAAEQSRGDSGR